jgi:LmbE family N-acetylglucosaminyl deacetylase
MSAGHDAIYVSPHPDDAVMSAGGSIALDVRAGLRVAVVTVFSRGDPDERTRLDEDRAAARRLGTEWIDLGLPEAPARDPRCRRPTALFAPLSEDDQPLVERVRTALADTSVNARLFAPLGVGHHRDHQIVHAACAALAKERARPVLFYEDVPYALCAVRTARRLDQIGASIALPRPGLLKERIAIARWWLERPVLAEEAPALMLPIAALWAARAEGDCPRAHGDSLNLTEERREIPEAMPDKLSAIADYATQWPRFYPTLDEFRAALAAHAHALGSPVAMERFFRCVEP